MSCLPKAEMKHPSWITPTLIRQTMETWQPYYETVLTESDAVDILMNVSGLFDTFTEDVA